ncbi:hypothetical protein SNEBB_011054 [Seison nebaliae]|nr:hypothetical protein SNEBB_011054 [Seison nebaliae]
MTTTAFHCLPTSDIQVNTTSSTDTSTNSTQAIAAAASFLAHLSQLPKKKESESIMTQAESNSSLHVMQLFRQLSQQNPNICPPSKLVQNDEIDTSGNESISTNNSNSSGNATNVAFHQINKQFYQLNKMIKPENNLININPELQQTIIMSQYDSPPVARNVPENNQVRLMTYKNEKIATFIVDGQDMMCLPQAFELFLKNLVGGLHTVYTKLKRLEITPVVCNVEQVRVLRGLGAIQPGVNRCKLITPTDFDALYNDCTSSGRARPGRPPKRGNSSGRDSESPTTSIQSSNQTDYSYDIKRHNNEKFNSKLKLTELEDNRHAMENGTDGKHKSNSFKENFHTLLFALQNHYKRNVNTDIPQLPSSLQSQQLPTSTNDWMRFLNNINGENNGQSEKSNRKRQNSADNGDCSAEKLRKSLTMDSTHSFIQTHKMEDNFKENPLSIDQLLVNENPSFSVKQELCSKLKKNESNDVNRWLMNNHNPIILQEMFIKLFTSMQKCQEILRTTMNDISTLIPYSMIDFDQLNSNNIDSLKDPCPPSSDETECVNGVTSSHSQEKITMENNEDMSSVSYHEQQSNSQQNNMITENEKN